MAVRSYLLPFVFLICAILAQVGQAQTVGASATWRVQKYDISISLPDGGRTVPVKAALTITNVSSAPAGTLTLRISPSADVTSIKVNGQATDFSKGDEKASATTNLQRLVTRLASVPSGGLVNVDVDYRLNVKDNSAVAALSPIGAQFLPLSYWYPTPNSWYFAKGADTAPFRIAVTALGQTVVSAGTETGGAFDAKLNAQPFFVVGSWDKIDTNNVAVFIPKGLPADGQKRAAELGALLTEAKAFGEIILGKAPDVPLRIIGARRGAGFSEAGTIIVDEGVFRRSKIDSLTAMNIAEAAAKLWLGGSIAVSGDGHGSITEGLSRYISTQFLESKFGKDVADVERLRQRISYAAISKRDAPLTAAAPIDDFYYPEVANKGAMVWRILAKRVGQNDFNNSLRSAAQDGKLDLAELRSAFPQQKELLDYLFDKTTDMNLLAGIPLSGAGETKIALRNTGAADVTVDVTATTSSGERLTAPTTIRAASFGEVVFKTPAKVVRAEIDSDKMYPQTDYSDDVAPRESSESDPLLAVKKLFDKQDFAGAESTARTMLRDLPRFEDLRIFLGRALLAQNKNAEAEKEFRAVLDEKLPTARSLAWANVGLAEAASKANRNDDAVKFAGATINADAEYGATLAARNLRNKLNVPASIDPGVKSFFADFDRAAISNKRADVEALVLAGEIARFSSGIAGNAQQWQTQVTRVDRIDENSVLVEASMTVKLLNKDVQTGMAVYRLIKAGSGWSLAAVDMFEVR